MNYSAILHGNINGQIIFVSGKGTIINGLTNGNYILEQLPDKFEPQILKGLLITGYPNATHSIDNSVNIFQGKSYTYKRILNFSNGGRIEMFADCVLSENQLISKFTVNGSLFIEERIENSEPLIEVWEPTKENVLSGLFRITWKTKNGNYLSADARSEYFPLGVTQQLPILHRYIEIESVEENNLFSLSQKSFLFHRLNIDKGEL